MHPDQYEYAKFTRRARLEKSVNSLIGLVEGIAIDGRINPSEITFFNRWLVEHQELKDLHPYNELIPRVQEAIEDGVFSAEERDDVRWLCDRLCSTEYYDKTTAELQRLHGILGGVIADGVVTEEELRGLSQWMNEHEHLRTCWPYDEVGSLITTVMADKKIDEREQKILMNFFSEFVHVLDEKTIVSPSISVETTLVGLCAVCPEIDFKGQRFCFTGSSTRHTRAELTSLVTSLGGEVAGFPSSKVSYLIIGAEGNPCWAYACYGRKVEMAVKLRKEGARILIVHENDFHDAVADSH